MAVPSNIASQSHPISTPKSAAREGADAGALREIPLTKGKVALVDAADFEWLSEWKWCISSTGYAVRSYRPGPGVQVFLAMHRVICPPPPGCVTDHANRDRLDNRRCNLRAASNSQNVMNRPYRNKTGFRGVAHGYMGAFEASIMTADGRRRLGKFPTAAEAAAAYDKAARWHFGEFALLNFPEPA